MNSLKIFSILFMGLFTSFSCDELPGNISVSGNKSITQENVPNDKSKDYWYAGKAELSSYHLKQARYGELHEGTAVLVYVTEPFSKRSNTKADAPTSKDVSVLKLNAARKFNTGIYPYSMMTSTFFPFEKGKHSLKISSSSQEWCGHSYMELTNKRNFEVKFDSYFEGQTHGVKKVSKEFLEDDLWSMIRLNPDNLPVGKIKMIPSFFYLRFRNKEVKAYEVEISISKVDESTTQYVLRYPELDRTMTFKFETEFPHKITSWKDKYESGYGKQQKMLTTEAVLMKSIQSDYWNKNLNKDKSMRAKLGLE